MDLEFNPQVLGQNHRGPVASPFQVAREELKTEPSGRTTATRPGLHQSHSYPTLSFDPRFPLWK
ncbi:hypothetical protein M413DRAFT_442989 [Hebeloma cylindrosporum]|uniref:Uncharacterized protein n=1 Tax=Hebeloma cylindrosporum TaxID=76867 RepID=A0A0C2YSA5_HEBCY|nr:hypothetical protein M413DRAFT_442989 [Hebeloma cylindrosporum h7]